MCWIKSLQSVVFVSKLAKNASKYNTCIRFKEIQMSILCRVVHDQVWSSYTLNAKSLTDTNIVVIYVH